MQTQTSSDDYTLSQSGGLSSDSSETYTVTETGTTGLTATITVDAINGNTTLSQTASDSYTLIETGSNDDFATFTQTIQGSDNANLSQNSNWRSGQYSLNGSATGTATDTTVGTLADESDSTSESDTTSTSATDSFNYQMTGDGNPLVGSVSMDTSDNRYDNLLIEIPNGSQAVDSQQPGTVDFRPFGKPYVEAGMPGNQTQTGTGPGGLAGGGAGAEIAQSAAVTQPGAGYLMGAGNAQSVNGSEWSGAAGLSSYASYGSEQYLQSCFRAGTPIVTKEGSKPAEAVAVGDWLSSRAELDPDGPVVYKRVEEGFRRVAPVQDLQVDGQVIGTTAEHPFFREGDGWVPCKRLRVGDRVRLEGGWGVVEGIVDSGELTTVYNWRVADYHTYFVGGDDWGFAVWVHNADRNYDDPAFGDEDFDQAEALEGASLEDQVRQYIEGVTTETLPAKGKVGSEARDFQIEHCGETERHIEDCGVEIDADGVDFEEGKFVDAKHSSLFGNSPYVEGSTAHDAVKAGTMQNLEGELERYATIVNHPGNPMRGVILLTNNKEAVPLLEEKMREAGLEPDVRVVPCPRCGSNL